WVFPGSTRSLADQIRSFILVNLTGQATMLAIATIARQLLFVVQVGPLIAGAVAHALGIGAAAIVNYLGHRHLTFTTAPARRRRCWAAHPPANCTAPMAIATAASVGSMTGMPNAASSG